jgi:hypothetical protein
MLYIGGQKEVVYGSYYLFPMLREERNYMLFPAKGNVKVAEWSARAQISQLLVRSCGNFCPNFAVRECKYWCCFCTQHKAERDGRVVTLWKKNAMCTQCAFRVLLLRFLKIYVFCPHN